MTSTKPKVRKVAWVVLGVVVTLAAATLAFQWDSIWLNVAYEEYWLGDSTDGRDYVEALVWELNILPPAKAVEAFTVITVMKRATWLPGPEHLVVFYAANGREVGRYEREP